MEIEIENVSKRFKNNTLALNHIDMSIGKGILGLLGKNGSGKTTLMKLLTTLYKPTQGDISILGITYEPKNYNRIKKKIGYLPQEFGFYANYKIEEIMEYLAILKGIDSRKTSQEITKLLDYVGLSKHRNKMYNQLSGGMKRRVGLAQAMLGKPPVLIVDEPTAGVDPEERINIRNLLAEYSQENVVIFSTHIIEDIEHTCNQLAVLHYGKLLFCDNMKQLLDKAKNTLWECNFRDIQEFNLFKAEKHMILDYKMENSVISARVISNTKPTMQSHSLEVTLEEAYLYLTLVEEDSYE